MTRPHPILCYITDSSQLERPGDLLGHIDAAFRAGIDMVQVREKRLTARALGLLVEQAVALPSKGAAKLLVNERVDVALACGADGVHLPGRSLPPAVILELGRPDFLIGVSCHSADEVVSAAKGGASYALLAPVFATPGKGLPLGLEPLREACTRAGDAFPVLALGGITEAHAEACLEAGAAGLAAIRLFQSTHAAEAIHRLHRLHR